jgi:hypothetical protein
MIRRVSLRTLLLCVWLAPGFFAPIGCGGGSSEGETAADVAAQIAKQRSELQAREDDSLNRYGWLDREKGQVRIPVSEAMRILAAGR